MLENIDVFRLANSMARHAQTRQSLIAENVANADTPGYRARDLTPFSETYQAGSIGMQQTRAGHIGTATGVTSANPEAHFAANTESPNGNTVSLEHQMLNATEVKRQHDMALTVFQSSLNILRSSLGRR